MALNSWASSSNVRKSMRSNKSSDTHPELALRRRLHALGMRYRICVRPLKEVRRTADIVFSSAKVAIEVHGCFWHGCTEHYRAPKSNANYWEEKVRRNIERDRENSNRLEAEGWALKVVWEHDDFNQAADEIATLVQTRRENQK